MKKTSRIASRLVPAPLGYLVLGLGCTPEQAPTTAKRTVEYASRHTVEMQDPGILWDLMPKSYQNDIHDWCRRLADRLTELRAAAAYDKLFLVLRKFGVVVKTKREYLVEYPMLKTLLTFLGQADEADLLAMFTAIGDVFILLGKSEIATVAKLRKIDLRGFLRNTGARLWLHGARAYRVTGNEAAASLRGLKCRTLSATPTRETLEIRYGDVKTKMDFVRVEERWIPAELAERWPEIRAGVVRAIKTWTLPGGDGEPFASIQATLDALLVDLEKVQATERRGAFNREAERVVLKYGKKLRTWIGF